MKRMTGRNIYIVDLGGVIAGRGLANFLRRAEESHFDAIWIRMGRGQGVDRNLGHPDLALIRAVLKAEGVDVWGWHVPFCKTPEAASREAELVLAWSDAARLDGVILDVERTPEYPRFQGGSLEAEIFASRIAAGLATRDKPVALSSHDQPLLHRNVPYQTLLAHIEDVCPQVYYQSGHVAARLEKSVRNYRTLLPPQQFVGRYKPTGNITVSDNLPLASAAECVHAARQFTAQVQAAGYFAHSFWCWDAAPDEIWRFFQETPV